MKRAQKEKVVPPVSDGAVARQSKPAKRPARKGTTAVQHPSVAPVPTTPVDVVAVEVKDDHQPQPLQPTSELNIPVAPVSISVVAPSDKELVLVARQHPHYETLLELLRWVASGQRAVRLLADDIASTANANKRGDLVRVLDELRIPRALLHYDEETDDFLNVY